VKASASWLCRGYRAASAPAAYASRMVLPPPLQDLLPAGRLAFTGRESNPLDRDEGFQITSSSSLPGLFLAQHPKTCTEPASRTANSIALRSPRRIAYRAYASASSMLKGSGDGGARAARQVPDHAALSRRHGRQYLRKAPGLRASAGAIRIGMDFYRAPDSAGCHRVLVMSKRTTRRRLPLLASTASG
jgi:hypothetical protein